jgi:hypothetical protein
MKTNLRRKGEEVKAKIAAFFLACFYKLKKKWKRKRSGPSAAMIRTTADGC